MLPLVSWTQDAHFDLITRQAFSYVHQRHGVLGVLSLLNAYVFSTLQFIRSSHTFIPSRHSFAVLETSILSAAASSHGPHLSRHAELAKRADSDVQLFRRVTGSRWTYYNVETGNAGSCGKKHVNTDFTVAMNAAQMNPGWCFKTIRMTQGGKTTTATVTDTCPGCPWGGLDLTEGLFGFFIGHWPVGGGVLSGDWEFTDAAPPPPPPKPTSKPPPPPPVTTNAKPKTTSSIVSHKPTSTSTKISSSTISKTSSSVSSSSTIASTSIDYLSGPASGLAIPTGSIDRTDSSPSNLQDLNQFLIQVGGLAMAAGAL